MAQSLVVSGRVAKRAEMAGLIDHHRKEIARRVGDLAHLDATIKLFAPDYDLRSVRAKQYRRRNGYFKAGECQRLVLEIFRDAGRRLSSRDIAESLVERKGLESSRLMIEQMQKNALGVLKRLTADDSVRPAGKHGVGQTWELV
jgi:hypothetical protein